MLISEIIKKFKKISLFKGKLDSDISYIQSDSRKLETNDIFCLYENFAEKSLEYLEDALGKKVKTILIKKNSPYLKDANKFEIS
jgi:hypothetical protein